MSAGCTRAGAAGAPFAAAEDDVDLLLLPVAMSEGAARVWRQALVAEPGLLALERPCGEASLEARPHIERLGRVLQLLEVPDRVARHAAPLSRAGEASR